MRYFGLLNSSQDRLQALPGRHYYASAQRHLPDAQHEAVHMKEGNHTERDRRGWPRFTNRVYSGDRGDEVPMR
ncbi:UNVERIFIED_CONTAM: hypothetical protein Sradi_2933100 [Sesamum radiatum]|uniref:Uncharacterized protein n=1 Tax=Sesamum radiatum TaxID=300843 RepID=A0AAW2RZ81_SESRA